MTDANENMCNGKLSTLLKGDGLYMRDTIKTKTVDDDPPT